MAIMMEDSHMIQSWVNNRDYENYFQISLWKLFILCCADALLDNVELITNHVEKISSLK